MSLENTRSHQYHRRNQWKNNCKNANSSFKNLWTN